MFTKKGLARKIYSWLSLFALTFNLLQPTFLALTFSPTIIPSAIQAEEAQAPLADPTPAPSNESTPEPTVAPAPDPTPSTDPDPTPETSPSPTPASLPSLPPSVSPSPEPTDTLTSPQPSADSLPAPPQASDTPTPAPSSINLDEQLHITIINNTQADSIEEFDLKVIESGSATLSTDKLDYAPTDTALITGNDFSPHATYSLTISSTDAPATSTTVSVTTDDDGKFFYTYQLDGIYRPNYKVEAYLGSMLVATVTFTDSPVCQNDVNGANDYSGQKDLTKMCNLGSADPTRLNTSWNWDDISWSGNNTGDACNLFDTDNDGNVNYAVCVTIGSSPAVIQSTTLYSCGDTKSDRCHQPINTLPGPYTTSCSGATSADDPFPLGDASPSDTKGTCNIALSEVGGSNSTKLIDVCSYPSQQPNSDPSDCIIATQAQTGKLEIIKNLSPANDPGQFNLLVDGSILATGGNGTTTGEQIVLASGGSGTPHTFSESEGSNTLLSNYNTTASCVKGTTPVSVSGTNPWTVNVGNNDDIVCTITNTRINNATLTIVKDAVPNDPQDFSFTTTGTGLNNFSLDDDPNSATPNTITFSNLAAGTYSVAETAVAGWDLTSATCNDDNSTVNNINLSAGENVTCTFTNTKRGTIIVEKDMVGGTDSFGFTGNLAGTISSDNGQLTLSVAPGTYTSVEESKTGWQLDSIVCNDTTNGGVASIGDINTRTATFNVEAGETVKCTFTNTKLGTITVEKQTLPDGDPTSFSFTPSYGSSFSLGDGQTNTSNYLYPGTYSVTENTQSGWTLTGKTCSDQSDPGSISLSAGENVSCTFTNTKHGSIAGVKYNDLNGDGDWDAGEPVASGWLISLLDDEDNVIATDTTDANGEYSFADLLPGLYSLTETLQDGWVQTGSPSDVNLSAGQNSTGNNFFNFQTTNVSGQKFNDRNGNGVKEVGEEGIPNWTIYLGSGNATTSTTTDSNGNYQFSGLVPGSYTVSEDTSVAGWTQTYPAGSTYTFEAVSGQNKTGYDFGNHAKGKITLVKSVTNNNGGAAGVNDFGLSIGGVNVNSGTTLTLPAYNSYALNEVGLPGYNFVSITGHAKCPSVLGGSVTLAPNDDLTCTITNDDQPGTLTVTKITVPTDSTTTFSITATGSGTIQGNATRNLKDGAPVVYTLDAGNYTVTETVPAGWDQTGNTCNDVLVTNGKNSTCTITNHELGHVTVVKYNDHNGNGTQDPGDETLNDWEINLDKLSQWTGAQVAGQVTFSDLMPGSYVLSESLQSGWTQTNISCSSDSELGIDNDNNHGVTVNPGETTTCKIGNAPLTDIHGYKWNDINGNGTRDCDLLSEFSLLKRLDACNYTEELIGDWTIFLDENDNQKLDEGEESTTTNNDTESEHFGWYWFEDLFPGTYTICEVQQNGWQQTYPSFDSEVACHTVTVPNDNHQTENGVVGPEYHFGNQAEPELLLQKTNDAGGNKNPGDLVTYTLKLNLKR